MCNWEYRIISVNIIESHRSDGERLCHLIVNIRVEWSRKIRLRNIAFTLRDIVLSNLIKLRAS